ncbi:hypothetical protein K7G98_23075, partial [Saccharothrix sp. MB29]|nr:hypothetical protein [Saccharothrix sp. MB29]
TDPVPAESTAGFHGDADGLLSPEDFVVTFDPDSTGNSNVTASDDHVAVFDPRPGAPSDWQPATRDYRITSDGVVPPFTKHAYEPVLRSGDGFPAVLAELPRTTPRKPPVVFSADGTMAVPQADGDGHFKEFYATAEVVADANTRLRDVGSKVELRTVPGNVLRRSGKKLLMVQLDFTSNPAGVPSEFSGQVIGDKHRQLVLRPPVDSTQPVLGRTGKGQGVPRHPRAGRRAGEDRARAHPEPAVAAGRGSHDVHRGPGRVPQTGQGVRHRTEDRHGRALPLGRGGRAVGREPARVGEARRGVHHPVHRRARRRRARAGQGELRPRPRPFHRRARAAGRRVEPPLRWCGGDQRRRPG